MSFGDCLYVDDGQGKGSDINQEDFPIYSFPLLILRLLDPNNDIQMDSNQVYNLIQIG